jgi:hypothetical protein
MDFAGEFDLLPGRRTYDIFSGYWPLHGDNPIGARAGRHHRRAGRGAFLTFCGRARFGGPTKGESGAAPLAVSTFRAHLLL